MEEDNVIKGEIPLTNLNNANTLPPKSCTIDRLITATDDVQKVITGKKTATRRNRRYADIGEIMNLDGHAFIVENLYQQSLGEVTDDDAKREGYQSLDKYKEAILSIHPGMKWVPAMKVWVHEFKPVE